ncbi:MAG: glycosyltransferase involved in cell wall biosynthesis [Oleispira sp.]|jgi:glycosyltransferase involved in cell wall biosynthesis
MNTVNRVLIIGYVWPEPNSSAAGSRMMQLITAMRAQDWQVTFASPAQLSDHMADLSEHDVTCQAIELNNESFDQYITELNPDMVIFDRFMMEEQFGWRVEKFCPTAMRVLNTEDLHSLREARQKAVKKGDSFQLSSAQSSTSEPSKAKQLAQYLHSDLAIREVAAIFRSDLTLMISPVEVELLVEHFKVPQQQLMYLPFMLTPLSDDHIATLPTFDDREHFITIGNFRHAPNWDVVLQLKQHIWPLIRKQLPKAEMHIYGAYPPPKATQLHNAKQGFYIKGWAEDAKAVMKQARLCLAPIRFGAGIKGKLSDAMECGTPSITTELGCEGMLQDQLWNGEIINSQEMINNPQVFADAAVKAYQNESAFIQHQQKGFAILAKQYDKTYWQEQFINRLIEQSETLASSRNNNFFGLMLRHHSMKSTQYMAQWIEAKNKKSEA